MATYEYFMDGTMWVCKRHYREHYLEIGKRLSKYKSPRLGLCVFCSEENQHLSPLPPVSPITNMRALKTKVHRIVKMAPLVNSKKEIDKGLRVLPNGRPRWVFPKRLSFRSDQVRAIENLVSPANFLIRFKWDYGSNRWTLELFRREFATGTKSCP